MVQEENTHTRTLPGLASHILTILKYEMYNYFRSRRFYILLAISLLISGLLTGVIGYYRPDIFLSNELNFYANWWGMSVTFVIVLSGIFFGGDAISSEFQNKTGYFLIPNPIRRSSIYIGKWLSAFIASSIILLIYTSITIANGIYYFGASVPYEFILSLLFTWFYLVAVLGFTFFFSSLFKNSSISILLTAILFLFVFNLLQNLIAGLIQIEPWFLVTYGAQIIANVLIVPYPEHVVTINAGPNLSLTQYNVGIPEGLIIIAAYFLITAVLGLVFFERKEFT